MASLEEEQQPTLAEDTFVNEGEVASESISSDSSEVTVIESEIQATANSPQSDSTNYFGYTPAGRRFPPKAYFEDTPPDTNGNVLVPRKRRSYCEAAIVKKSQWSLKTKIPVFKWTRPTPKLYNCPSVAISV